MKWIFPALGFVVAACGGAEATPSPAAENVPAVAAPVEPVLTEAAELAEPTSPAPDAAEVEPGKKAKIYEERAITDADLDEALARAKEDNKHVLLMFGGNWCGWCHKLHELIEADATLASALAGGYVRVMVDSHTNDALLGKFAIELEGVPFLVVLDANGEVLVRQETGSLEEGPVHDPAKVLAFLDQWRPRA